MSTFPDSSADYHHQPPRLLPSKSQRLRDDLVRRNQRAVRSNLHCLEYKFRQSSSGNCSFTQGTIDFVVSIRRDGKAYNIQCRIYGTGTGEDSHSLWFRKLENILLKSSIDIRWTESNTIEMRQEMRADQIQQLERFKASLGNFTKAAKVAETMATRWPKQWHKARRILASLAAF